MLIGQSYGQVEGNNWKNPAITCKNLTCGWKYPYLEESSWVLYSVGITPNSFLKTLEK
jgi:hypothetical protein